MPETINVNLTVNGYPLDPSKAYIIEVKGDEVTQEHAKALINALQQLNIKHVMVSTRSGEAVSVVEVPEEVK